MNLIRGIAYWRTCGRRYELKIDGEMCLAEITKDGKRTKTRPEDKVIIRHVIEELKSREYEFTCETSCSLYDEEMHIFPDDENLVHFIPDDELVCYKIDSILSKSFLISIPKRVEVKPKRYDIWEDNTLNSSEQFDEWFLEWTLDTQRIIRNFDNDILDVINVTEVEICINRFKKKILEDKKLKKALRRKAFFRVILNTILLLNLAYFILPKGFKFRTEYNLSKFLDATSDSSFFSTNDEVTISDIKNALESNPYFSEEDKELFGNLWKIIEENREYIDLKEIVQNISEFNFIKSERTPDISSSVVATYTFYGENKNDINIYERYDELSEGEKNNVKLHEVGHGLTKYHPFSGTGDFLETWCYIFDKASSLRCSILDELADEFFARDYCSYLNGEEPIFDDTVGYSLYMPPFYGVGEIIGGEPIREFKFTRDLGVLVEALSSVDGDIERAYNFLMLFEELDTAVENSTLCESQQIELLISQELAYYYEARFNRAIYDDVYMCLHLYGTVYESPEMGKTLEKFFGSSNIEFSINSIKKYLAHEGMDYSIVKANGRTYVVNEDNRYLNHSKEEKVMTMKPISS